MALVASLLAAPAEAGCRLQLLPETGLAFRQDLQRHIRDLGITGFGRTQPYQDSTISLFMASEIGLVLREQDQLLIEIGAELPLPSDPLELAKFNALAAFAASRFSGEDMQQLRARLLASLVAHRDNASWIERSGELKLEFSRAVQALLVKMHREKCDAG